jgi:hypothetical protein
MVIKLAVAIVKNENRTAIQPFRKIQRVDVPVGGRTIPG